MESEVLCFRYYSSLLKLKTNLYSRKSVGIDLGTTNSLICVIENGFPKIIPVDNSSTMPSIVNFVKRDDKKTLYNNEKNIVSAASVKLDSSKIDTKLRGYNNYNDIDILVGKFARNQLTANSTNTFQSIKRIIGKSKKEVFEVSQNMNDHAFLSLTQNSDNGCNAEKQLYLKCPVLDKLVTPEEISALILLKLLNTAESYLLENTDDIVDDSSNEAIMGRKSMITNAVITVPAYFLPHQYEATKIAAKMAGLQNIKLLKEPEAAALAYGIQSETDEIVIVFDLGGGTFDVSVLEIGKGYIEVIGTSGDSHLGGDDFDQVIVDWLFDELRNDLIRIGIKGKKIDNMIHYIQQGTYSQLRNQFYDTAKRAKHELSQYSTTEISMHLPQILEGYSLNCTLSQKHFTTLSETLLKRLLKPLREVAIISGINLIGDSNQRDNDQNFKSGNDEEQSRKNFTNNHVKNNRVNSKLQKRISSNASKKLRRLRKSISDPISMFPGGRTPDHVILVGGGTYIPAVKALVYHLTGIKPKCSLDPELAVALGAGVLAGILDNEIKNVNVISAWQAAIYREFLPLKLKSIE